ncbi:MAG: hypothetical protein LBJ64_11025 [Deltaproteobacteria bacterium]|nr:hypothetical protein [Deltaproteobacteria bacterium]
MTDIAVRAKDRLRLEEFELTEDAINVVAAMMGFTVTDLLAERAKENPNKEKITELEKKHLALGRERLDVYGGNDEVKRSVIERYSEYIRERVANA